MILLCERGTAFMLIVLNEADWQRRTDESLLLVHLYNFRAVKLIRGQRGTPVEC
jgi:hypothetical protein